MNDPNKIKRQKREMRHRRVRAKVKGTAQRPRFSIFRSNKHIFLQLIDDEKGKTIISASDRELKNAPHRRARLPRRQAGRKGEEKKERVGKAASAYEAGKLIAEKALKKKIKNAVFDRGGYAYHGRVKAAAEGARESGLVF